MKPESQELLTNLESSLEEIIKVYRHLLNVVRKERDILVSADLEELNLNNRSKEAMLLKARSLEEGRIELVKKIAQAEELPEEVRLLDLAKHFGGSVGERFLNLHSVLNLLLKRVREHNQHNEELVRTALNSVTGAMGDIRESIGEKRNYKKGGQMAENQTDSGQLVSREA